MTPTGTSAHGLRNLHSLYALGATDPWQGKHCQRRNNDCTFDVHVTVHRDKFLILKPTRCTNFSNFILEWNSICFGKFLCPSSGLQAVSKTGWRIQLLCVQWITPDDGQRNCPKHAEFYSKNKFEKLVHLVGFIIRSLDSINITWLINNHCQNNYYNSITGMSSGR